MTGNPSNPNSGPQSGADAFMRLDKWLWHARFFKSRSSASTFTASGNVRINGTRQTRSSARVRPGDMLTFALHGHVRVIEVLSLSVRRGPAVEAQTLYHDHEPPSLKPNSERDRPPAQRAPGAGRPTKRDRRVQDAFIEKGNYQS